MKINKKKRVKYDYRIENILMNMGSVRRKTERIRRLGSLLFIQLFFWNTVLLPICAESLNQGVSEQKSEEEVLNVSRFILIDESNAVTSEKTGNQWSGGLLKICCFIEEKGILSMKIHIKKTDEPFMEETVLSRETSYHDDQFKANQEECWIGYLYLPEKQLQTLFSVDLLAMGKNERTYRCSFTYDFHAHCDSQGTKMKHFFPENHCIFCGQDRLIVGYSGETEWRLDRATNELRFSGEGMMCNYIDRYQVPWRSYYKEIKLLVIEEGITRIGANSFYGLTALKKLTLPESLTVIGDYAFKKCKKIKEIIIPSQTQVLGNSAFFGCESLEKALLPKSVDKIGEYCFAHCTNLKEIRFEGSVPVLGKQSFREVEANGFYPVGDAEWPIFLSNGPELGGKINWIQ